MTVEFITTKKCTKCLEILLKESFTKAKGYLRPACRQCMYKVYSKPWKLKNSKPKKHRTTLTDEERKLRKKEYKFRNKHKLKKERIEYYQKKKNDPIWRAARNLRKRLKKQLDKGFRNGPTISMLGCTIIEFRDYIAKQFDQGMTWDNYGEWHLDHIKPVCSFDLTDTEQVALINHYSNLRPLWAKDNIAKSLEDSKQKYVR